MCMNNLRQFLYNSGWSGLESVPQVLKVSLITCNLLPAKKKKDLEHTEAIPHELWLNNMQLKEVMHANKRQMADRP